VATIGLLTFFFRSLLEKGWMTLIISGLLTGLYVFIFFLLAMMDYAFLAGNIGLFVLLAALMIISAGTGSSGRSLCRAQCLRHPPANSHCKGRTVGFPSSLIPGLFLRCRTSRIGRAFNKGMI
jgi:hypothetical protein